MVTVLAPAVLWDVENVHQLPVVTFRTGAIFKFVFQDSAVFALKVSAELKFNAYQLLALLVPVFFCFVKRQVFAIVWRHYCFVLSAL